MKLSITLLALSAGAVSVSAAPRHWTRQHQAFEAAREVRSGWKYVAKPHPEQLIDLSIALKETGNIWDHLNEVSDADHARYGQHLTKEEVDDFMAASDETFDLVQQWLRSHGLTSAHHDSNWVNVRVPVRVAEQMLAAEYGVYTDGTSKILRTEAYSLPARLHEHIDLVSPTIYFGKPSAMANTIADNYYQKLGYGEEVPDDYPYEMPQLAYNGLCNSTNVTLACMARHYGYDNYTAQAADKNSFGITGFLGEHLNFADLNQFLEMFRPEANDTYTVKLINGGTNPQNFTEEGEGEAALDVQEALGIAYPAKGTFWSTNGIPPIWPDELTSAAINSQGAGNEPYLTWVQSVLAQKTVPYVISTSYDDDEQTVPFSFATRVCNEFAKLGARGVTLLFSAGDFGPGGVQPTNCTVNDGSNNHRLLANFPSSCPAVTAVGGTTGFSPEYVTLFPRGGASGGGGFSEYFSRPSYQPKETIQGYLSKVNYTKQRLLPFNEEGRAYPDISFNGRNFSIIFNGKNVRISGTSASAPGLAGFLTLLNDARLAAGKSVLGFINPLLYSGKLSGDAFRDTTVGSNPAFTPGCAYTLGFPALEGWDASTGFGSPVFEPMREQVLALP